MEPEDLIDHTIALVRASAIIELRMMAQGPPWENMASEEVVTVVGWVLRRTSDELEDALTSGYLDGQNGHHILLLVYANLQVKDN